MKFATWPQDTIALRFAVTVVLTIGVAVASMGLFFVFGGEWTQPDMERSELPGNADGVVRAIDAAPRELRPNLVTAISSKKFHVGWYPETSAVATALNEAMGPSSLPSAYYELLGDTYPIMRGFAPDESVSAIPVLSEFREKYPQSYFLVIKLRDESWLVFSTSKRTWGASNNLRMLLFGALCILSTLVVSTFAARQLSSPVTRLAEAVRSFGLNPLSPAIAETGPQEIRQVIKTFNTMQAQIQKFVSYRTAMLAAISHDLRTPLTRMRLRGEFIEDTEQQARLFRDVDEMRAMIDGVLAFFRDDSADEKPTTFDLSGVLNTIVNDYADQKIEIKCTGPARVICHGRPFALKRAFTNLVENAVKYATPPEIELSHNTDVVVIAVRDRGPGIPGEFLERVFDPFFRLDKSRNRNSGGVGLGLTAVKSIIQEHSGEITLANRSEGGLEVRVTIPMPKRPVEIAILRQPD